MKEESNPYQSPETAPTPVANIPDDTEEFEDGTFHLNLRRSDNFIQAACMLVSISIFAFAGTAYAIFFDAELPWYGGSTLGSITGLFIGFFASGTALPIYRKSVGRQKK